MAVDAGTGSVRAVLFSLEGEQLGCVQQEWTHREDPRYPGSMDFDWVHNWDLARGCIRGVIEQTGVDPHDIAAVSTTCMREGIVLYDKDGQEIWACANVDARSDDEVAQLVHMNPELEKQIYRESGQTYALGALPRLFWVKNKMPEVYEKTAMCTMFNDWLIYKMTGVFSSEPSNACTTGIFDLKARDWDDQIAASIFCCLDALQNHICCIYRECRKSLHSGGYCHRLYIQLIALFYHITVKEAAFPCCDCIDEMMLALICVAIRCRCSPEQCQLQCISIHADAIFAVVEQCCAVAAVTQCAVAMIAHFKAIPVVSSGTMSRTLYISKLHLINAVFCVNIYRECNFQQTMLLAPLYSRLKLYALAAGIQCNILHIRRCIDAAVHSQAHS